VVGTGDDSAEARSVAARPPSSGPEAPDHVERAITHQPQGFRTQTLLTSLLEVAAVYT
jgi:hypothetical protein